MAGGGGKNGDYWPGFVDALTNVVIAMVFVIVVLAIALSFSAQMLAKRMAARIAEQQAELGRARAAAKGPPAEVEKMPSGPLVEARAPVRTRIPVAGNEAALAESPALRLEVVAVGPEIHLSENQRAAYIRAMAVRNELLGQGIPGERIVTRIDMKAQPPGPAVGVRIGEGR